MQQEAAEVHISANKYSQKGYLAEIEITESGFLVTKLTRCSGFVSVLSEICMAGCFCVVRFGRGVGRGTERKGELGRGPEG